MQAAAPSPEVQAEALVARYLTPTTDDAHTAWTDAYADDVVQRRAATAGSALFVDHWLKEAGLTGTLGLSHAADLFPPRSLSDLFVLVVELLSCAAEAPTRQALLLYLALEPVAVPTPLPDAVRDLAHSLSMSQGEINDVTAYWAVDRGHLEVRGIHSPSTRCRFAAPRPMPLSCWSGSLRPPNFCCLLCSFTKHFRL